MLHNRAHGENWAKGLMEWVRNVQQKPKKLMSLAQEAEFFEGFGKWYGNFVKLATEMVQRMVTWHNTVLKILKRQQENEVSLAYILQLLQEEQGKRRK
jgi:hypothetical protein